MRRELVLQLKLGCVSPAYFSDKYGVDVVRQFEEQFAASKLEGYVAQADEEVVRLTREGLLRVDALLPRFFLPQHSGIRYT